MREFVAILRAAPRQYAVPVVAVIALALLKFALEERGPWF